MEWITKEGNSIEVKNMTTSHIENCLKLLEERKEEVPEYYGDSDTDGTFGIMMSANTASEMYRNEIQEWIDIFQQELRERNKQ